jgi:hypothetical protein
VWSANEAEWEDGFSHLETFVADNGHALVPSKFVADDGYPLGRWVVKQRSRKDRFSPERTARLEALPNWEWNARDKAWETGFSRLERFVARERTARVPRGHVEDGFLLGAWVKEQRTNHRKGRLSDERAARLGALPGWVWDATQKS